MHTIALFALSYCATARCDLYDGQVFQGRGIPPEGEDEAYVTRCRLRRLYLGREDDAPRSSGRLRLQAL